MTQYIDKDPLLKAIKVKRNQLVNLMNQIPYASNYPVWSSNVDLLDEIKKAIDILEVDLEEEIIIPRWFLENIEDTLRIQYNINFEKKKETCQDRNIKGALNGVRKLLYGKELTGMERSEKLISYTLEAKEIDLEEEICNFFSNNPIPYEHITDWPLLKNCAIHFFELGLKMNQKGE